MRNAHLGLGQAEVNNPAISADGSFAMGGNRYIGRDYYVYSAEGNPIPAAGNVTDQITIQADADFVVQKMTFSAFASTPIALTNNTRIIPAVTVQLTDTGSGRELLDAPIFIPSIFGTGELPFILPTPRLLKARSTLKVQFANQDASTAVIVQLALIGYKAYQFTG